MDWEGGLVIKGLPQKLYNNLCKSKCSGTQPVILGLVQQEGKQRKENLCGNLQPDSLECVGANNKQGALFQTRLMSRIMGKVFFRSLGMCCSMLVHVSQNLHAHTSHTQNNKQVE